MPTYHFYCDNCRDEFIAQLPMGSVDIPLCETCKLSKNVRKVIKPPMVHFKGSGFYKTDSTSSLSKTLSSKGKESGSEDKAKGSIEAKAVNDTKPVEKTIEAPSIPKVV